MHVREEVEKSDWERGHPILVGIMVWDVHRLLGELLYFFELGLLQGIWVSKGL